MTDPQTVLDAVAAQTGAISKVSRFVHEHPELGHEEHECSGYLCDLLASAGLQVERGVAGMETAFRATLAGAGSGRTTGLVCLYDAVAAVRPDGRTEAVHSCGHGPIAGGVTGAALALSQLRGSLAGAVVVIGCPADEIHAPGTIERGGGKAIGAEAGLWDGVDAALYAHPEFVDTVSLESRWMRRATATVAGSRSLGSADQPPLQAALSALEVARSLLPDDVMLERLAYEGDVEEDTGLVLKATFLLFGDEEAGVERGLAIVQDALPAATLERRAARRSGPARRPRHGCSGGGVSRARPRLRREPAAAPVRDGLRQHLATLSGCPRRCGPTRRLEVPYRRGRRPIRVAGRRRGRVDDRAGARPRGCRPLRIRRLAAPEEPPPERSQEQTQAADRLRFRCLLRRTFLREHRREARGELPRQLLGDAAEHRPAVLGDGSAELELRGEFHPSATPGRSQTGADRRLCTALALTSFALTVRTAIPSASESCSCFTSERNCSEIGPSLTVCSTSHVWSSIVRSRLAPGIQGTTRGTSVRSAHAACCEACTSNPLSIRTPANLAMPKRPPE